MRPRTTIIAICLVMATTCPNVTLGQDSEPQIPEWVGIGPDGGSISALAIDPQNPKILYAGTRTGLFKSTDGAASWKLSNSGLPTPAVGFAAYAYAVVSLGIDPQTPSTIYAGVRGASLPLCGGACNIPVSGGIFKSTDSGATWSAVNSGLEGEWFLGSLTIDPWNPTTLYAATYHTIGDASCMHGPPCPPLRYAYGVFKTMDGGENWYPASAGLPSADVRSVSLAIDPQDPSMLYYGTTNGVFKSTNGGVTWQSVMSGVLVSNGVLVIDSIDHDTVYVGTTTGILKTTNGGKSWYPASSPGAVTSLTIDPQLRGTLYAAVSYRPSSGIFKSVDGGVSWLKVSDETAAVTLKIDPSDSNTIYAATSGHGLLKTRDEGSSWTLASSGLRQTYVQTLAADPQNIGSLYASTTQVGILKTTDQGMNWSKVDSGLVWNPGIAALAVDPQAAGTVYALISGAVDPLWQPGGVFKSIDGGTTWSMASSGLETFFILNDSALLIDPQNPNTMYLTRVGSPGTCCIQSFKSMDGGMNWATAGFGNHILMAIDPQTPTTLYASSDYGTVSKSRDSGATWNDIPLPPEAVTSDDDEFWNPVISVTVDPRNSSVVYAAGSGGLFKSTDGGTSWQTMNSGMTPYICTVLTTCGEPYWVGSLMVDPQNSKTLYARTTGGILRSVDAAASWSAVNKGLLAPTIHSIGSMAIHPKDSTVYLATDDGVYAISFRP